VMGIDLWTMPSTAELIAVAIGISTIASEVVR